MYSYEESPSALRADPDAVVIYVVRHAEHVTSALAHLSRKGSLQAISIANTLKRQRKVSAVYSSPRSIETARNISTEINVPTTVDSRLLPYDGGRLIGWSMDKVAQELPEVYQKRFVERNPDFKVPDGESLNDRFQRVKMFLTDVVHNHRGQQVVVVTHGGIIDDMFRNARSLPPTQLTGLKKPYGSLSMLIFSHGKFQEEVWGGVDHLPKVVAESPTGGQLYLFPHQVGGSIPMLRGDLGELCKPATQSEMEVYEVFQKECPAVSQFAPAYMGKVVIDVNHILSNEGNLDGLIQAMHSPQEAEENGDEAEMNDETSMSNSTPSEVKSTSPVAAAPMQATDPLRTPILPQQGTGNAKRRRAVSRSARSQFSDRMLEAAKRRKPVVAAGSSCSTSILCAEDIESTMTDEVSLGGDSPKQQQRGGLHGPSPASSAQPVEQQPLAALERASSDMMMIESSASGANTATPIASHASSVASNSLVSASNKNKDRVWSVKDLWTNFITSKKNKSVSVGPGKYVYLVMENLTHGLLRPFILDLKMGTQQHGSNQSAAKIASMQARVNSTTSRSVGARVGGMQIYDEREQTYVLKDKYWGRALDREGLEASLRLFVLDQESDSVRKNIVRDIVFQLDQLEAAVKTTYWRFYGCSLLIVYDGASTSMCDESKLNNNSASGGPGDHPGQRSKAGNVRQRIGSSSSDNSDNSTHSNPETAMDHFTSSSGSLMEGIVASRSHELPHTYGNGRRLSGPGSAQKFKGGRNRSLSFDNDAEYRSFRRSKGLVSVRLIDFAKTERHKTGESCDSGLLLGIKSLLKIFRTMLLEAPARSRVARSESCSAMMRNSSDFA